MPSRAFIPFQSKKVVLTEASLLIIVVAAIDRATGWELSMSLPYAIIVFLVAWTGDRKAALVFALLCGASWWWANLESHPYRTSWGYTWATITRFAYFLFVAVGGTALKARQEADRARIEALERARDLEHEITVISEREQCRIGQDLHDGICQTLAAVHCALTDSRDQLRAAGVADVRGIDDAVQMLKDAMVETRNLARGIFPVQMDEAGFPAALEELVASTRRLQRVDATFEASDNAIVKDPETAMHLYRITQEAINNAVKHGGAGRISVALSADDGSIRLTVTDDGRGMPDPLPGERGMGLKTMRYRAQMMHADLSISNNPGRGTTVTCTLKKPGAR